MIYASATHVGRVRQDNEDYLIAKDGIYIVADGMGGHDAGDVASKVAAETVLANIESSNQEDKLAALKTALEEANKKVLKISEQMKTKSGMGTTLTIALIEGMKAYFAHIGDSRAYLFRDNKLTQLSEDHSLVAQMVREGKLSSSEARDHPYRSVITRAIGSEVNIKIDLFSYDLKAGDKILIASDGLTSLLTDSQISKIITANAKLTKASNNLVKEANNEGGLDNISVILIEMSEEKSTPSHKKKKSKYSQTTKSSKTRRPTGKTNKPKIWKKLSLFGLSLVLVLSLVLAGSYIKNSSFYLSTRKGKVVLYQGLPYKILGLKLSNVKFTSDVESKDLDNTMKKRLAKKIVVRNKKAGISAINDMAEEAKE